jgi:hypothetical protein
MSLLFGFYKFSENIMTYKQTDVSAECEDSIQFEDKYGNFIINGSTVNIYQY